MRSVLPAPVRRWCRELRLALLDLTLPPHCPGCGQTQVAGLCEPCRIDLHERLAPWCDRCGESLGLVGAECQDDHRWLQGLAFARAPFAYRGTGGALVRRLKLDGDFGAGERLARAVAQALAGRLTGAWRRAVLVAVPLHPQRRRQRGFDQALLLAQGIGAKLRLRVEDRVLRRTRATLPQGDPRVTNRSRNVDGAFAVVRPRAVRGALVVLIDDVVTSGATARSCAAVLRAAGAEAVALATACRA